MEKEKLKVPFPIVVEGKYDKIKLSSLIDGEIIVTDGFGLFKQKGKLDLIKRLSKNGVIVLTDSDGAGKVIRSHLSSAIPKDKIYNLYIPKIEGKEKRKKAPSKEGTLGVEGMDMRLLRELFEGFIKNHPADDEKREKITKNDLFLCAMTGAEKSAERRDSAAEKLGLPTGLTAPAFLGAVNMIIQREEFMRLFCPDTNGKEDN